MAMNIQIAIIQKKKTIMVHKMPPVLSKFI
jgi:hypothetical protein